MSETFNAPLQLVYPAAAAMALSIEERRECRANAVEPGNATSCETPLNIGVFFDGTNNNAERDEPERAHSNVVRLFNAHPSVDSKDELCRPGHYRIYVPGVGTPFKANAELRESVEGKAFGKGGQARILFAVLQVFNSIYRAFQSNIPLFDGAAIAAKVKAFTAQTEGGHQSPETPCYTRDQWLSELNRDIGASIWKARKDAPLPRIPEIYVSVFGFSRGAAEAVAFCHWLDEALPQGKIAGMPVRIGFLGLFDCVASVGLADSGRRAMGLEFSDGHFAWAKEVRVTLPSIVARVVHMMAAHEQRLNFPLTRIRANCKHTEFVYPGVHSDVGGGYLPLMDMDTRQGAQALRDMLRLFVGADDAIAARQVDGLIGSRIAPVTRRLPGNGPLVYGRGVQCDLTVDEDAFSGTSPYLFGLVLEHYLARHVSINVFTETRLESMQRGMVASWDARMGTRSAV